MEAAQESINAIGNLCTFRCPGYKKIFHSKSALLGHFNRKVSKTCLELRDTVKWQTCVEEVVTHKCKICSKLLLCDNTLILLHVRDNHNIKTIGEYVKKTACTLQTHENNKEFFKVTAVGFGFKDKVYIHKSRVK